MDKISFLMYLDYEEQFNLLTDEQLGQLMRAIMKYEKTRELPQLDGIVKMAFSFIKQQLDRDNEKWQEERQKRSEAGKKGMAKRWKNNNNVITENNKNNSVKNIITRNICSMQKLCQSRIWACRANRIEIRIKETNTRMKSIISGYPLPPHPL